MAELMLGQPLFPGESGIDQLVEIIKVLGTPTREQIRTMNPNYMEHKFPQIKPHPFSKVAVKSSPILLLVPLFLLSLSLSFFFSLVSTAFPRFILPSWLIHSVSFGVTGLPQSISGRDWSYFEAPRIHPDTTTFCCRSNVPSVLRRTQRPEYQTTRFKGRQWGFEGSAKAFRF